MTTETMTVHKALAELKMLDSRILKEIQNSTFCVANKHSNEKINGVPIDDVKKNIQGCYDRVTDLINRRKAIKRAVVLSNAVTKVAIAGKEYAVAEAIEMKNHGTDFEVKFATAMNIQHKNALLEIKGQNGKDLETRADQYVTALYGNKDSKNISADAEKTRNEFLVNNAYELVDPINIVEKINEISRRTEEFMSEVDAALSVSNALTEITVEY